MANGLAMLQQLQQMGMNRRQMEMAEEQWAAKQAQTQQGLDLGALIGQAGAQAPITEASPVNPALMQEYLQQTAQGPLPEEQAMALPQPQIASPQQQLESILPALLQSENPQALGAASTVSTMLDRIQDNTKGFRAVGPDQLTSEVAYVNHAFATEEGRVPENQEEWQQAMDIAYGPKYQGLRQSFTNPRVADRYKNLGVDSNDPSRIISYDSKNNVTYSIPLGAESLVDEKLKILGEAGIEKLGNMTSLMRTMGDIDTLYTPEYVGAIDSRAREIGKSFFDMPGYTQFKQKVMQMVRLAYQISGRQLSDAERKYITEAFLPQPGWSEENFQATSTNLGNFLMNMTSDWVDTAQSARFFVPGNILGQMDELKQQITPHSALMGDVAKAYEGKIEGDKPSLQQANTWMLMNGFNRMSDGEYNNMWEQRFQTPTLDLGDIGSIYDTAFSNLGVDATDDEIEAEVERLRGGQ